LERVSTSTESRVTRRNVLCTGLVLLSYGCEPVPFSNRACAGIGCGYQLRPCRGVIAALARALAADPERVGLPVHRPHYQPGSGNGTASHSPLDHHRRHGRNKRGRRTGSRRSAASAAAGGILQVFVMVSAEDAHGNDAWHLSDGPHRRQPLRYRDRSLRPESAANSALEAVAGCQ
jgi:hypothetical protein